MEGDGDGGERYVLVRWDTAVPTEEKLSCPEKTEKESSCPEKTEEKPSYPEKTEEESSCLEKAGDKAEPIATKEEAIEKQKSEDRQPQQPKTPQQRSPCWICGELEHVAEEQQNWPFFCSVCKTVRNIFKAEKERERKTYF